VNSWRKETSKMSAMQIFILHAYQNIPSPTY
jgi:hypothetical protein